MEFDGRGKEHLGHFVMQCKWWDRKSVV
jgi:hypothetical protein